MMVEWLGFAINTLIPILFGVIVLLALALFVGYREVKKRIPDKAEMMDMGYTVLNTVVEEKAAELGLSDLLASSKTGSPPTASGAGRPGEGLFGKLMWFAENTEIGRALASRFMGTIGGGGGGGGGGEGPPQDYYG